MADLFDLAEPRADVLAGTLTDAVFAASLDEVVAETAPTAYGDAPTFFDATYPSAGLRSLLDEALGRAGGGRPDGAPVIRLETNLGGGKTHNLIALYHAARTIRSSRTSPAPRLPMNLAGTRNELPARQQPEACRSAEPSVAT